MSDARMDKAQAEALAAFIALLRPGWDAAGIMAALGQGRMMGTAADLAVAAIAAAMEPSNRTPAIIAKPGAHWTHVALRHKSSANITAPRQETCSICYLPEFRCREVWAKDHEYESIVTAKRRALAAPPRYARTSVVGRPINDVELP